MDNPKYIYAGNPDKGRPWIFIPDTAEAKAKAIEEGYSAFSTMSFDYEPEKGKPHFAGELHHPLGGGGGRDAGLRQRRPPAGGLPPLLPVPAKVYVRQL